MFYPLIFPTQGGEGPRFKHVIRIEENYVASPGLLDSIIPCTPEGMPGEPFVPEAGIIGAKQTSDACGVIRRTVVDKYGFEF